MWKEEVAGLTSIQRCVTVVTSVMESVVKSRQHRLSLSPSWQVRTQNILLHTCPFVLVPFCTLRNLVTGTLATNNVDGGLDA